MKQYFRRLLCCVLALLLPVGGALAEPARWLDPWIAAIEQENLATRGVCSFEIDSAALSALLTPLLDAASVSSGTMLDTTEEEAAALQAQTLQTIALLRQALDTYMGSAAALINRMTVKIERAGQDARYGICLGQEPVMEFTLLHPAEGPQLLLSDLYPSYALELDEENPILTPDSDILSLEANVTLPTGSDISEDEEALEKLLAALPDYADYHFLAGMVDASRLELETLADKGLATREGNALRYTGTQEELQALLDEMELPYDPLYRRMLNALESPQEDWEAAEDDARASEEEAPQTMVFEIVRDTVLEETVRVHSYTAYDEKINPETGAVSRVARPAEWEERSTLRYSPDGLSLEETEGPASRYAVILDASAADEIICRITIWEKSTENQINLRLSRTEGVQALTCDWNGAEGGGLVLPLNDSDTETVTLPPLRCSLEIANDCSHVDFSFGVCQEEAWRTLFGVTYTGEVLSEAPAFPAAEERIRVSPTALGAYTDAGYRGELRQVAVPRLNRLVLTKLPPEARPLLTPLLSIIGQLGQ